MQINQDLATATQPAKKAESVSDLVVEKQQEAEKEEEVDERAVDTGTNSLSNVSENEAEAEERMVNVGSGSSSESSGEAVRICDMCGNTIIGPCHHSLDQVEYDLCQMCFDAEERVATRWKFLMSPASD